MTGTKKAPSPATRPPVTGICDRTIDADAIARHPAIPKQVVERPKLQVA
ncbi:MAG: hypothetical protein HC925_04995 [Coleofasciculaceae cyanobacterium SM2_3_26]|nr:hypothetical protein [Coleofasciculaceae cyanobacterium SM2_3_26]